MGEGVLALFSREDEGGWRVEGEPSYLGYWGHGKLQGRAGDGIGEVELILLGEALVLDVGRSAVPCDEGVHGGVVL